MSQQKPKEQRLNIRLSPQQWDKIHRLAARTTCRSVSDYARKVLTETPVRTFYRNQSFDEFDEKMTTLLPVLEKQSTLLEELLHELSAPSSYLNPVKTLESTHQHIASLDENISTIKTLIEKLFDHETQNNDREKHC